MIPRPSYPLFDFLAALGDISTHTYHLEYDGAWYLDRDSLSAAITPRTRIVLVVSPNNPSGSHFDAAEHRHVYTAAATHGLAVISDEVFADFASSGHAAVSALHAGAGADVLRFSLNGLSKVAGLPQLKLGWIVLDGPPDLVDEARARLEIIGDTYLSVGTPVQAALPELLQLAEPWQSALRTRIAANRATLHALCAETPIRVRGGSGGWSALIDLPRRHSDEFWTARFLAADGVATHPGYLFDLDNHSTAVLSLIVPPTTFDEGISRICARVQAETD